jgi:hypothetical protein
VVSCIPPWCTASHRPLVVVERSASCAGLASCQWETRTRLKMAVASHLTSQLMRTGSVSRSAGMRARSGSMYIPLLCGLPVISSSFWKRQGGWILSTSLRLCACVALVLRPVGMRGDGSMYRATRASHHLIVVVKKAGSCAFALAWPQCHSQQGSVQVIDHVPQLLPAPLWPNTKLFGRKSPPRARAWCHGPSRGKWETAERAGVVVVYHHIARSCHLVIVMGMERGCIAAPLHLRGLGVVVSGEST